MDIINIKKRTRKHGCAGNFKLKNDRNKNTGFFVVVLSLKLHWESDRLEKTTNWDQYFFHFSQKLVFKTKAPQKGSLLVLENNFFNTMD